MATVPAARVFELDEHVTCGAVRHLPGASPPPAGGPVRAHALDYGETITLGLGRAAPWRKLPPSWSAADVVPPYRVSRFEDVARVASDDGGNTEDGVDSGPSQPAPSPAAPVPSAAPDFITITVPTGGGAGGSPTAPLAGGSPSPEPVASSPGPEAEAGTGEEGGLSLSLGELRDEELRRDLRDLAGEAGVGAGGWPGERAAPGSATAQAAAEGPTAAAAAGAPTRGAGSTAHDVFDGMNMGLAQTFDVGTFDLARQLAAFDAAMDRAAATAPAVPPSPFEAETPDTLSPAEAHAEALEDLHQIREAAQVPAQPVHLLLPVPLIAATSQLEAHAAAAAMLVAWRDGLKVDPAALATWTGPWEPFAALRGASGPRFFAGWGLEIARHPHRRTVEGLRHQLTAHGPLWCSSDPPDAHARVLTGLVGDGTPEGTRVLVADPWDQGREAFTLPNLGSTYELPFEQLAAGPPLLVAHLRRPERGRDRADRPPDQPAQ